MGNLIKLKLKMKFYCIAMLALGSNAIKLERETLLTWAPTPKKSAYPQDYGVPNFGVDHDVRHTLESMSGEESRQGHQWVGPPAKPPPGPPQNYFVPNFGRDADINDSIKNLGNQEAAKGAWNYPKDDWYVQEKFDDSNKMFLQVNHY